MTNIPWRETAVLIRETRNPSTNETTREIVEEGTLRDIVFDMRKTSSAARTKLKITLPDRKVPPYQYTGDEIAALIVAHVGVPIARRG